MELSDFVFFVATIQIGNDLREAKYPHIFTVNITSCYE